jgi:hypothetical protein
MKINGKEYVYAIGRNPGEEKLKAHLYLGAFGKIKGPMCRYGWNREDGHGFSIARFNLGEIGICAICQRRAEKKLLPVKPKTRKTRWL